MRDPPRLAGAVNWDRCRSGEAVTLDDHTAYLVKYGNAARVIGV